MTTIKLSTLDISRIAELISAEGLTVDEETRGRVRNLFIGRPGRRPGQSSYVLMIGPAWADESGRYAAVPGVLKAARDGHPQPGETVWTSAPGDDEAQAARTIVNLMRWM